MNYMYKDYFSEERFSIKMTLSDIVLNLAIYIIILYMIL